MNIELTLETLSPLHLGSGEADVNVDAEVVHDAYGMPYVPGRRFKGLLYESALEVEEIAKRSGLAKLSALSAAALFRHSGETAATNAVSCQLVVPNLYLSSSDGYPALVAAWERLQTDYPDLLRPADLLEEYTSLRYQTKLTNGVAAKGSLHNMRVIHAGITFAGTLSLQGSDAEAGLPLLAASVRNLRHAGLKRTRGFGEIICHLSVQDGAHKGATEETILEEVLA